MRYIFLLLFLLPGIIQAQQLPPLDSLEASLKLYYNKSWTAERAEFTDIQRGKSWNLVPSVGLVFGLPSVNLNTGQIANYMERKAVNKAKLKSMDLKYGVLLNEELQKLRIEYRKLEKHKEKAGADAQLMKIKQEIFSIYQEAYDKKEMKPLEFLQKKLEHETTVQEALLREKDYQIAVLELMRLARYGMPEEPIWYEGNQDCIMLGAKR